MDLFSESRAFKIGTIIGALIGLLAVIPVAAQVSVTLQDGGYFYVVVAGDTVSQHFRLDKAIESGSEHESFDVVQDFRLRGRSYFYDETIIIEEVTDTVFVTADPPLIQFYSVGTENMADSSGNRIGNVFKFSAQTRADSSKAIIECGGETYGAWNETANKNVFYVDYLAPCMDYAVTRGMFYSGGELTEVRDSFPAWSLDIVTHDTPPVGGYLTAFDNFNPDKWRQTWGDLNYSAMPGELAISLPSRSIARVEWLTIPEHRDIRYRIVETVDPSHSTGAHIGGRHSPDDANKNSVETYLNSRGIGVSIFHEGSWSNPVNFPVAWEFGERIEYTVEIVDDTITVYAGGETYEYSSDLIGSVPAGRFALGSTGAGGYFIHEIEVEILD